MKTLKELVSECIKTKNMNTDQAKSYVCQAVLLEKISLSPFTDKILLKGGVVMYNMTHNLRRSTSDLDFDFIRYDISNDSSIYDFVKLLNKHLPEYIVGIRQIEQLHQQDYKGKRVKITIEDSTERISFSLDIGVHTLFAIEQEDVCFYFDIIGKNIMLKVNAIEQMFAEKLFALAKFGALSTRNKDIFDLYYLIKEKKPKKDSIRQCLDLLLLCKTDGITCIEDMCGIVDDTFKDKGFIANFESEKHKWLDVSRSEIFTAILDFVYEI